MSHRSSARKFGVWTRLLRLMLGGGSRTEPDDPRARSWARRIESLADVPEIYTPFFDSPPGTRREPFPHTVLTPSFRGYTGRPQKERLLCIVYGQVHVLESVEGCLRTTCFSPAQVSFLERGSILLFAWISITGGVGNATRSVSVRYSPVTDHLMLPFLECLRAPTTAGNSADLAAERARFDYLRQGHFKFMSYGQGSIRPGARVRRILLQPQIRHEYLGLFGVALSRLVWPSHLTILTDSEVILIRDDDSQHWIMGSPHGAIWTYIPRRKIEDASITPAEDGRLALSFVLSGGASIRSIFDSTLAPQLELLLEELRS